MDGILSDLSLRKSIENGDIEIDPFDPAQLNVTSYDLTLGDEVRVYRRWVWGATDGLYSNPDQGIHARQEGVLDSKEEPETISWKFDDKEGIVLRPGIGYLMHTRERVRTRIYNPVLDGKSSIGRLFVQVHATAGYGDPNFNGQYTLEVIAQHPIRLYAGMRICQIRFHTISGELGKTYDQVGHYVGESAKGAVASQAWRQFQD